MPEPHLRLDLGASVGRSETRHAAGPILNAPHVAHQPPNQGTHAALGYILCTIGWGEETVLRAGNIGPGMG